jgi:hypothetical protein
MPRLIKETFKAWIDHLSHGGPTLVVIGRVQVPTTGWNVGLARRSPQGTDPEVLMLDVHAEPQSGRVDERIIRVPVRYEERIPTRYSRVAVADDSEMTMIELGSALSINASMPARPRTIG